MTRITTIKELEAFYEQFPVGAMVQINTSGHKWLPGRVTERYGRHGTVYIGYKLFTGETGWILYSRRRTIRLAEPAKTPGQLADEHFMEQMEHNAEKKAN